MGTPRQPQLVPASRGYIQFTAGVPAAALAGIEQYSHIWIIFEFHANTDTNASQKTKIRPPRAPRDTKVGQLATRSPHRPNPLGLSLVKLERWDETTRQLHVSGLDLVNHTPVYDIKPVVPWDIPGFPAFRVPLTVPTWVEQDDVIPCVRFEIRALEGLRDAVHQGRLAPLYTNTNRGFEAAQQTLLEILAQDPRSSHKGVTGNGRGSSSEQAYKLIFCETQVSFVCERQEVKVTEVQVIEFDKSQYVDGVPLISL
jgi:tRNA-Thr(GGU) m(6)t(6)A37 methyltransferase TsaA